MELIDLKTMQIKDIDSSKDCSIFQNTILTIGVFDGVHLAHQKIIERMNTLKEKEQYSALMTFDPHPDYVLGKRIDEGYLTPINTKIEIFQKLKIDYLIIIHFTKEIANMDYVDFYNRYLSNFAYFVIGYDFRFGAKALGTPAYLKTQKNKTEIIPEIEFKENKLSSTLIRSLLEEGKIEEVNEILGNSYSITGYVSTGAHIGQTLGFPTANIQLKENYQAIRNGVYFVKAVYENQTYYGIANVGHNPSINYVKDKRLEVHLFDFNLSIYGKNLNVYFLNYLREEKKFNNKEELIKQIQIDKEKAFILMNKNRM